MPQILSTYIYIYIHIYIYMPEGPKCQHRCQKVECHSICARYTSRWYVRSYVRTACHGGDHPKLRNFGILCSTLPKSANVCREDLRETKGKEGRQKGVIRKENGKELEQFRKNRQDKVRQTDKQKEKTKHEGKEEQTKENKRRKGKKKEGTAKT